MKLIIDIDKPTFDDIIATNGITGHLGRVDWCIRNSKPYEERPTGYWKDHRWCSNCGCGIPTDVYGTSITEEEAHFCVECGARMEA